MISKIKRFNRRNGVTTIVVAHPTKMQRDCNGGVLRPSLYDIAGSAHWFNKCDVGIVVDRDWDTITDTDGKERMVRSARTVVDLRKVRFNWIGKPGSITLEYDEETSQYRDPEV